MASLKLLFTLALLQIVIEICHGMCDQRPFGGKLKCCTKKDSNCFVKVNNSRRRGNQNTICYCDDYCKFTNDCCSNVSKVKSLCRRREYMVFLTNPAFKDCQQCYDFTLKSSLKKIKVEY